jgi:hypothetical protein
MRRLPAAAVLHCALATLILVGCGDDEEAASPTADPSPSASAVPNRAPANSPTAAATATEQSESDGEDGFRAFAAQIEAALEDDDGLFFAERAVEQDLICAGDEQVGLCTDQPAGTAFRGIPRGIFQTDAFALTSADDYADDLVYWFENAHPGLEDAFGDGTVALYAVAYKPAGGGGEEAYQAIITAIVTSDPESVRQARSLSFRFVDGRWRLTGEIAANLPQTAEAWLSGGCDYCYDRWERWKGP